MAQNKIISGTNSLLIKKLESCYSGALYDVLRKKGLCNQVLPSYIRPLNPSHIVVGQVYTVEGKKDNSLSERDSLMKWCGLLSKAPADKVLICQPNDHTVAHMGELSAETLAFKKVRGYIVDGGCRDTAFIEKTGFPVFFSYTTPVDVVSNWAPVATGESIIIGDVLIHNGDYVLADRDGIVIIPEAIAAKVIEQTTRVLKTENLVRKTILQGTDPVKAYRKYGKF